MLFFFNESSMQVEGNVKQINHLLELKIFYKMKKCKTFLLLFVTISFGQTVNNYKAVIP
jgi:hypothetical protein